MTDRELLELAAKAAGYQIDARASFRTWQTFRNLALLNPQAGRTLWNPLTGDGDALRLAVRLRISIDFYGGVAEACWFEADARKTHSFEESINDAQDEREATRRAIVRAAAEIGKAMP
jgi:hypothetical protein